MVVIKPWTQLARDALLDYMTRTASDDQSDLEVEMTFDDGTPDDFETFSDIFSDDSSDSDM